MNGMEQRRRSKINEKLKALQNLIPNSNKVMYLCKFSSILSFFILYFNLSYKILLFFFLFLWMSE